VLDELLICPSALLHTGAFSTFEFCCQHTRSCSLQTHTFAASHCKDSDCAPHTMAKRSREHNATLEGPLKAYRDDYEWGARSSTAKQPWCRVMHKAYHVVSAYSESFRLDDARCEANHQRLCYNFTIRYASAYIMVCHHVLLPEGFVSASRSPWSMGLKPYLSHGAASQCFVGCRQCTAWLRDSCSLTILMSPNHRQRR
jgi:hypothetical protein